MGSRLTVRSLREHALSLLACVALSGCSSATPRPPATPAAALSTPSDTAVHASFYARDGEPWSLRDQAGKMICRLPCSAWVSADSKLSVVDDGQFLDGAPVTFEVPEQLPAVAGDELTITVDRTHAGGVLGKVIAAPSMVVFGLMGVAFTGISIASLATGSKDTTTNASGCVGAANTQGNGTSGCVSESSHGVAAGVGGLAVGVGSLAVAALAGYWFTKAREGGLRFEEPSPSSRISARFGPGVLEIGAKPVRTVIGPGGVIGTF